MSEAVDEEANAASDAVLIQAVRGGDVAAFGVLYERHFGAARRAAAGLVATSAEQDDLVAEAFTRVLQILRTGRGPTEAFRPYLLATMRNAVISWSRQPAVALTAEVPDVRRAVEHDDPVGSQVQATVAADAFANLPERWRMVLWHTEIEDESPAEIAPLLGMTPNGVSALAYRAREGLRQAYLQQYLPTIERQDCRRIVTQLAGWIRRGNAGRTQHIAAHLNQCPHCRTIAIRLRQINQDLPTIIAPVVLGAPWAMTYLSSPAGWLATSGTVVTAVTNTDIATTSWLTAVKAVVAAAALVTTTAFGVTASEPPTPGNALGTSLAPGQLPHPTEPNSTNTNASEWSPASTPMPAAAFPSDTRNGATAPSDETPTATQDTAPTAPAAKHSAKKAKSHAKSIKEQQKEPKEEIKKIKKPN